MRFGLARLRIVLTYVGTILFVLGFLMLIPFFFSILFAGGQGQDVRTGTFTIPLLISVVVGAACRLQIQRWKGPRDIGRPESMLVCTLGWVAVSALGAIPFSYHLGVSYLDAYFEAMSGFTTTGITMLSGLDFMPKSLLLWRAMTQWIGGLGILTFFLVLIFQGGPSYRLLGAESHKISGKRIAPGTWNTLKILWLVYTLFTLVVTVGLYLAGMNFFDAITHAFTCLSTGGYSNYDASIAYFQDSGYPHYIAIEYILIFGMWVGGTNFLIHYRLITGEMKALWDNGEMRTWWIILGGALLLVLGSRLWMLQSAGSPVAGQAHLHDSFRHSLFQVLSIATTTGYGTRDIASSYFTPLARQVFLVLMLIGGCAGSTAGGLKAARIAILWKMMVQQVRKVLKPDASIDMLLVDGKPLGATEVYRTAGLLFGWLFLLLFGAMTTAALSDYNAIESASGMFSALGNIGPCYIPAKGLTMLHPVIKLVYIVGMLAGRLEILPVLILFSGRAWK